MQEARGAAAAATGRCVNCLRSAPGGHRYCCRTCECTQGRSHGPRCNAANPAPGAAYPTPNGVNRALVAAAEATPQVTRAQLKDKTLKEVKKIARDYGIGEEDIENCDGNDNPQEAVIGLILAKQARQADAPAAAKLAAPSQVCLAGTCWRVSTKMWLTEVARGRVEGHGSNENGAFKVNGHGSIKGNCYLEATNDYGNFSLEIRYDASERKYTGKTLDEGYEGITCIFEDEAPLAVPPQTRYLWTQKAPPDDNITVIFGNVTAGDVVTRAQMEVMKAHNVFQICYDGDFIEEAQTAAEYTLVKTMLRVQGRPTAFDTKEAAITICSNDDLCLGVMEHSNGRFYLLEAGPHIFEPGTAGNFVKQLWKKEVAYSSEEEEGSKHNLYIVWVDADPNVNPAVLQQNGFIVYTYKETQDALNDMKVVWPLDHRLVGVCSSMMRGGGRSEAGLMDGLDFFDHIREQISIPSKARANVPKTTREDGEYSDSAYDLSCTLPRGSDAARIACSGTPSVRLDSSCASEASPSLDGEGGVDARDDDDDYEEYSRGACKPIFGIISVSADREEVLDRGVDVVVNDGDRQAFQNKIILGLNDPKHGSWRKKMADEYTPATCEKYLKHAAYDVKDDLENQDGITSFASSSSRCFCKACEPETVWHRGGEKYVLPSGWYRLGLLPRKEYANQRSLISTWPVAYHGTSRGCLASIINHRRIMFPGDTLDNGVVLENKHNLCWADRLGATSVIYCSPSILYASAPLYSPSFSVESEYGTKLVQVVMQVVVNPKCINKFPETLQGMYTDPHYPTKELEWVITDRTAMVPFAMLVRQLDFKAPEPINPMPAPQVKRQPGRRPKPALYDQWRKYVDETQVAFVRVGDVRERARKRQRLSRRQLMKGLQIGSRGDWDRDSQISYYVVCHPWLAMEHPDPSGFQLQMLVKQLDEIGAQNDDLTFYDWSSFPQIDGPKQRTPDEEKQFRSQLEDMTILFAAFENSVIVVPWVPDVTEQLPDVFTLTATGFYDRAHPFFELSLAVKFNAIANKESPDIATLIDKVLSEGHIQNPAMFAKVMKSKKFSGVGSGHNEEQRQKLVKKYQDFCNL